jgi:hypothetical protein
VSSVRAIVVGDQIPYRSSTPTSRTTLAGSGTLHSTTAENGYASTDTMSGVGVRVAFAPLDASAPNALRASRERAAERRSSIGSTSVAGAARCLPRTREGRAYIACVSATERRASISYGFER